MAREEVIRARGHENVTAAHASTLEITSEDHLTPAGDCIVGVAADRVPADFDPAFVAACRDRSVRITAVLAVAGREVRIEGRGDPALTFRSDRSHVCRTSEYVDDRTIMVGADTAAGDLARPLVERLAAGASLRVTLQVA